MEKIVLIGALALSAAGCVRVESSHVMTGQPQNGHAGPVEIVMEGHTPRPGYVEIAIVEGRGNGRAGMSGVIAQLQADAQRMGANAIINLRIDQGASIVSVTGVAVRC